MTSYAAFAPYLQQYHDMLANDDNEPPESPNTGTPGAREGKSWFNHNLIIHLVIA
jgi:hypothetical protein